MSLVYEFWKVIFHYQFINNIWICLCCISHRRQNGKLLFSVTVVFSRELGHVYTHMRVFTIISGARTLHL